MPDNGKLYQSDAVAIGMMLLPEFGNSRWMEIVNCEAQGQFLPRWMKLRLMIIAHWFANCQRCADNGD